VLLGAVVVEGRTFTAPADPAPAETMGVDLMKVLGPSLRDPTIETVPGPVVVGAVVADVRDLAALPGPTPVEALVGTLVLA
jgi:hypothetical protein